MSTSVTVSVEHLGSKVDVVVNVPAPNPTPTEFQATTELNGYTAVITNHSYDDVYKYMVVFYIPERDFPSYREFVGVRARRQAIAAAAKLLLGHTV